jgi:hypothetical protein
MFAVLVTLTVLGCEQRPAGPRSSGMRHIVAVATAPRAVDGDLRALRDLPGAHDGSLRVRTASSAFGAAACGGTRARGQSLWLSRDIDEDDHGSRSPAGPDGDDPIAPVRDVPVPDAIGAAGLDMSSGPIARGVGPSLGYIRITKPPPRARARA